MPRSASLENAPAGAAPVGFDVARWSKDAFIPGPWFRALRVTGLVALDAALVCSGLAIAVAFWAIPVRGQSYSLYLELWPALLALLLGFAYGGIYPGFGIGPVETLKRYWKWSSFSFLAVVSMSFVAKMPHLYSRVTIGWTWLFTLLVLPAARILIVNSFYKRAKWPEPTVVLTSREDADEVPDLLSRHHTLGYTAPWVFRTRAMSSEAPEAELPGAGKLKELVHRGVRVAIVVCDSVSGLQNILRTCETQFRTVIVLQDQPNLPLHLAHVRNLEGRLAIEIRHELLRRRNRFVKRFLDIIIASVALIPALPVIAVGAIATKVASRGPVFYSQQREGKDGTPFRMWKIRTMHGDAEDKLEEHLATDRIARQEWSRNVKLAEDPRVVPRVGRFLRRYSIDELPQLWNVLAGQMSLVGPRPLPEYHLRQFSPEFRKFRRRVLPGITGLWQVSMRSESDTNQQQALDEYYIRNWSLWIDLYLLARTASAVVSARGAY